MGQSEEPPQVARMVARIDALLAVVESNAADSAAERTASLQWGAVAAMAVAAACACVLGWLAVSQIYRCNSIGGRARALMELSIALDNGGKQAAEQMADAAGVRAEVVHAWHAAWKAAWRGPG